MADWRQIQARIRKAKNSVDARVKLTELYQRTHDAMVSWELGVVEEKAERNEEAIKWYTMSAEKFRRSDWKKKAEDALTRLGAPIPAAGQKTEEPAKIAEESSATESDAESARAESHTGLAVGEIPADEEEETEEAETSETATADATSADGTQTGADGKKKRRRGRRGGRGRRRKGGAVAAPGLPNQAFAEQKAAPAAAPVRVPSPTPSRYQPAVVPNRSEGSERRPSAYEAEHGASSRASSAEPPPVPMLPSERTAHGRAGDPALASRMAKLDSMLRRLVASPLHRMDDTDTAPAGPGVFLLSDSDQITSYYVESCQTLRVGIGNLVRGSGSGRSAKPMRGARPGPEGGLKAKLAEHLGIGEAKVSQYLKDHCVVRWIQLDEDASHLMHFAIGVLRTPLNMD